MHQLQRDPTPPQAWLVACLSEARLALDALGSDFAGFVSSLDELGCRLDEGRFRLAVLGQFKRGKSSLLNALLGETLLPAGLLPVTGVPTVLRYGPERRVQVVWLDGRTERRTGSTETLATVLRRYVTEQENPGNRLGIREVAVEHPAAILATGLEILDTPGIGSTALHNTRTTRDVLPSCDGALVVLSPDPPITEVEVQFLRAVRDHAARLRFVLTKADLLPLAERDECLAFLRQVLHREIGCAPDERVFLVSAHQALEARMKGDEALWTRSGLAALEDHLTGFASTDKRAVLQEAIRRKSARLVREALFALDLRQKAVRIPAQELARRAERFEAHLKMIEEERLSVRDRLEGDRRRVIEELERRADALFAEATEALNARARKAREAAVGTGGPVREERAVRAALAEEVDAVFARAARDWLAKVSTTFRSIRDRQCGVVETLIGRIRQTAADLFEVPGLDPIALDRLEQVSEPRVIRHRWVTSFTEEALSWLSRLLPRPLRARRFERRLRQEIEYLVKRNIGELRWVIQQSLDQTVRTFQTRLDAQIEAVIGLVRSSIRSALDRQVRREATQATEEHRLEEARQRLAALAADLSPTEQPEPGGGPL